MTEFRTETTRTEPLRPARVVRFNDMIMEYLIALTRALAVAGALWAAVSVFAFIWSGDWRWIATLVSALAMSAGAGWFGFIRHFNEEWKEKKDGPAE